MPTDWEEVEQLAVEYSDVLFRFAFGRCSDRALAGDVVQKVFVTLLTNWPTYRENMLANPGGYLFVAVRHALVSHNRTVERDGALVTQLATSPEHRAGHRDALELVCNRVRQAIRKLPDKHQEIIFLKFYAGWDRDMISHEMGLAPATVSNYLSRATEQLRRLLSGLMSNEEGRNVR